MKLTGISTVPSFPKPEIMTLEELQNRIKRTVGMDLPTAAWLSAGNSPLVVSRELEGGTRLSVYQNRLLLIGSALLFRGHVKRIFKKLTFNQSVTREQATGVSEFLKNIGL